MDWKFENWEKMYSKFWNWHIKLAKTLQKSRNNTGSDHILTMQTTNNQKMAGTKVPTSKVWKCPIFSDLARFSGNLAVSWQTLIAFGVLNYFYSRILVGGSFPSVDQLSFQHLVCRCIVFIGLFCWKIRRKLRSRKVDDRVFQSCWTSFQHWALGGSTWNQSIYRSLFDESAGNSLESLSTEGYARVFQGRLWHFANSVDRRTVWPLDRRIGVRAR